MIRRLCCALLLGAPGLGLAVEHATCMMVEHLLLDLDRSLTQLAAEKPTLRSAAGIRTMATEALARAERFATTDPLPGTVASALSAIAETAERHRFIVPAAADLLQHGLVVQAAMAKICPQSKAPDLARHGR